MNSKMREATSIGILAKVYELLSAFSARDLRSAVRLGNVSPTMASALDSLARVRDELDENVRPSRREKESQVSGSISSSKEGRASQGAVELSRVLEEVILNPTIFKNAREAGEQLNKARLHVFVGSKDSRQRVLSKARTAILKLSSAEQKRALSELARFLERDQSSGWFRVIRGDGG